MTREQELQAIDEAIKAGLIRRVPMWETSNWDELTFRERKAIAFRGMQKAIKMRTLMER